VSFGPPRVHAEEVAGKESSLITTRACANFDNDVLLVGGVLRQQQQTHTFLARGLLSHQPLDLSMRQLGHFIVTLVSSELPGPIQLSLGRKIRPVLSDDWLDLGLLPREIR